MNALIAREATNTAPVAAALFASALQPSQCPSSAEVREAVLATRRRLGVMGCLAEMAAEFGDHPDCAANRMTWALSMIEHA